MAEQTSLRRSQPTSSQPRWMPILSARRITMEPCACRREQSAEIFEGYARAGGLASGDEVIQKMRTCQASQPLSQLARWVVGRSLIVVSVQAHYLFPRLQFDETTGRVRAGVSDAIAELRDVYDDLEIATWFVRNNAWLDQRAPWELLACDDACVLRAARADRFVARG